MTLNKNAYNLQNYAKTNTYTDDDYEADQDNSWLDEVEEGYSLSEFEEEFFDSTILIQNKTVVISLDDGESFTFHKDSPNFEEAKDLAFAYISDECLSKTQVQKFRNLSSLKYALEDWSDGKLKITGNSVSFQGGDIPPPLVNHLLKLFKDSKDPQQTQVEFKSWSKFIEKVNESKSNKVFNRLYMFLQHNDLKIDTDGDVLAFKVVSKNYRDKYSNTIDNSVGANPNVPRIAVDDDDSTYCSNGLHVCSYSYLKDFSNHGDPVMLVKVDVRDIVSIPLDYNGQKVRCCSYKVLKEIGVWGETLHADSLS